MDPQTNHSKWINDSEKLWLNHFGYHTQKKIPFDNIFGQDRKRKANTDGGDFSTTSKSFNDKKAKILLMNVLSESIIKLDI